MGVNNPPKWTDVKAKPTTVAGFGITDMASQSVASAVNATNASNVPWSGVASKPTTISGYGITDEKCRAWVNFNGTGTVAIRASGNVSSITDNGVGDYTVNFTTAMPDANYSVTGTAQAPVDGNTTPYYLHPFPSATYGNALSTGSARVQTRVTSTGGVADSAICSVAILR